MKEWTQARFGQAESVPGPNFTKTETRVRLWVAVFFRRKL